MHPDDAITKLTKEQMSKKAVKYEWDKDGVYTGNGQRQAQLNDPAIELGYDKMVSKAKVWKISEDKSKAGSGDRMAQTNLVTSKTTLPDGSVVEGELTEKNMAALSNRWLFPGGEKKEGEETPVSKSSAWSPEGLNTESVNDFIDNSIKWDFEKFDKEGTEKDMRSRQNAITDEEGNVISGIGVQEFSKEKMASASHKWGFGDNKYAVKGNRVQSAYEPEDLNTGDQESFTKGAKRWNMKQDGSKDGEGDRSRQNAVYDKDGNLVSGMGTAELDKESMIAGSKKWMFTDEYSKEGGGISSRRPPDVDETPRETMAEATH